MESLHLPIFPPGSLANSVVTTVWIGVTISVFFHQRFGWALSGLVVPGYLIPLFLIKPWAASVIIFESFVTYFVTIWISKKIGSGKLATSFFGRDRFYLILLVSVLVRLFFDSLILPVVGDYVNRHFDLAFDYRSNLHSFGLIIVALIANQFWKPGFKRGMVPLVVNLAMTYIAVRFILVPFTNFSMTNLNYMYEDLASSLLASPKAYIILLTTAYIASRMNLFYGWEFNGILIPSLLALQWYDPLKIVTSFVEAYSIMLIAMVMMKLPIYKGVTIEGGRKILMFFNISFAYKWILGLGLGYFFEDIKITDFYGFGYLLPALLAVKMHDKQILPQLTRATLQASLVSTIVASLVGYCLTLGTTYFQSRAAVENSDLEASKYEKVQDAIEQHKKNMLLLADDFMPQRYSAADYQQFEKGLWQLKQYIRSKDETNLQQAEIFFSRQGFTLSRNDPFLYLEDTATQGIRGLFIFNAEASRELLLEVPRPLVEWGTLASSVPLLFALDAQAIAISGYDFEGTLEKSSPLYKNFSHLHSVHKLWEEQGILQIRAEYQESNPSVYCHQLPMNLDYTKVDELVKNLAVHFFYKKEKNLLRNLHGNTYAELWLPRDVRLELYSNYYYSGRTLDLYEDNITITGHLQNWLLQNRQHIAKASSELYVKPELPDLLYFDREIITPIIEAVDFFGTVKSIDDELLPYLKFINAAALNYGYRLYLYENKNTTRQYLILDEVTTGPDRKHWGTYVFSLESQSPYIVQIPRPLFGINVFEFGVNLFEKIDAKALLIGGSNPRANADGSADITKPYNKENLFQLFHQVLLREAGDLPLLIAQCRALGPRDDGLSPDADAVIAFSDGITSMDQLDENAVGFVEALEAVSGKIRVVDGSPELSGFEVGPNLQYHYLKQSNNKTFAMIRLSAKLRSRYRQQEENSLLVKKLNKLNVPLLLDKNLADYIAELSSEAAADTVFPPDVLERLRSFASTRDIVLLASLLEDYPQLQVSGMIEANASVALLTVGSENIAEHLIVSLLSPNGTEIEVKKSEATPERIHRFLVDRDFVLKITP